MTREIATDTIFCAARTFAAKLYIENPQLASFPHATTARGWLILLCAVGAIAACTRILFHSRANNVRNFEQREPC
jgi:hypothetical protein